MQARWQEYKKKCIFELSYTQYGVSRRSAFEQNQLSK